MLLGLIAAAEDDMIQQPAKPLSTRHRARTLLLTNHLVSPRWHNNTRYIAPPRHGIYSREPILLWIERDLEKLQNKSDAHVYECIQEPGDVIFVPEMWSHGVENLAESVGVAMEFHLNTHKDETMRVDDYVQKEADEKQADDANPDLQPKKGGKAGQKKGRFANEL